MSTSKNDDEIVRDYVPKIDIQEGTISSLFLILGVVVKRHRNCSFKSLCVCSTVPEHAYSAYGRVQAKCIRSQHAGNGFDAGGALPSQTLTIATVVM